MLNEKIIEILKANQKDKFNFDFLESIGDVNILQQFYHFLIDSIPPERKNEVNLVLNDDFGLALMNNFGKDLHKHFHDVILINNGKAFINKLNPADFIFADDSIYSYTKSDSIHEYIQKSYKSVLEYPNNRTGIYKIVVIYDGLKEKNPVVKSIFRRKK